MKHYPQLLATMLISVIWLFSACTSPTEKNPTVPSVKIKDQTITVDIADSGSERMQGLSGREMLPPNHGMLFIFFQESAGSFWMKDMKFALDVLWINNNRIIDIDKNVLPPAQTENQPLLIHPGGAYTHVIEITAGWVDQNQINIGEQVTFQL